MVCFTLPQFNSKEGALTVQKLCIFIGMTAGSWVGWLLGDRFGMMTAFLISSLGSMVGVYLGWRIHRDYLG